MIKTSWIVKLIVQVTDAAGGLELTYNVGDVVINDVGTSSMLLRLFKFD